MAVSFVMRLFDVTKVSAADSLLAAFDVTCTSTPHQVAGFEWMEKSPKLGVDRLVYVGLRDLDVAEKHILKSLGIKAFSMQHVDKYGIGKVCQRQRLCLRTANCYLFHAQPALMS